MNLTFLIVGGVKCGLTALRKWVREHPQVFAINQETHYFRLQKEAGFTSLTQGKPNLVKKLCNSESDYLNYFKGTKKEIAVGEICSSYLNTISAEAIYKFNPHLKIIVVLRNPVDRAISAYRHLRINNKLKLPFTELIEQEEFSRLILKINDPISLALDSSKYGNNIIHYFIRFPKKQIKVILFEHLVTDPINTMENIYDFLGVSSVFVPEDLRELLYNFQAVDATATINLLDFDKGNNAGVQQELKTLNRSKLLKLFEQDIQMLHNLTGVDFSLWNSTVRS